MHLQNMALVFGPTLVRLNPLNTVNNCINENINQQNELIDYILFYYDEIFEINKNTTMQNSASSIAATNTDLSGSVTIATSVTTVTPNFI